VDEAGGNGQANGYGQAHDVHHALHEWGTTEQELIGAGEGPAVTGGSRS
jgi:hypothetical protein